MSRQALVTMVLTNEMPWRALSSGDVWAYAPRFRLDQSGCGLNIGSFENSVGDSNVQPGQDDDLMNCLHLWFRHL